MSDDDDDFDVEVADTRLGALRMDPWVDFPVAFLGFASRVLNATADLASDIQVTLALHANWRLERQALIESTSRSIEMLDSVPLTED